MNIFKVRKRHIYTYSFIFFPQNHTSTYMAKETKGAMEKLDLKARTALW